MCRERKVGDVREGGRVPTPTLCFPMHDSSAGSGCTFSYEAFVRCPYLEAADHPPGPPRPSVQWQTGPSIQLSRSPDIPRALLTCTYTMARGRGRPVIIHTLYASHLVQQANSTTCNTKYGWHNRRTPTPLSMLPGSSPPLQHPLPSPSPNPNQPEPRNLTGFSTQPTPPLSGCGGGP